MLTLEDIRTLQEMERGEVSPPKWIAEADWKGDGWPVCSTGRSAKDDKVWQVRTAPGHAPFADAKDEALFIAALRNAAPDLLALAAERLGAAFTGQQGLFEGQANG